MAERAGEDDAGVGSEVTRRSVPWVVRDGGLGFGGDWYAASYLAELLSGEDEGRVSTEDVDRLLALIEVGIQRARRETCAHCGRDIKVSSDGTFRRHKVGTDYFSPTCHGSWTTAPTEGATP